MRRLSRALGRTERFWDNLMGCRTDRSSRSPFFQTAVEQLEDRALPAGTSAFAIGAGIGVAPEVRVFDADGVEVRSFLAFDPSFTGGVRTALADLNKDGISDIVAAAGPGGGPHVRVFDGASGGELASFFAYDPTFRGGLNIAAGPIGNGEVGIATGAEEGGGPHVRVFTAAGEERASFYAYDAKFTGGVRVALGQRSDGSATVFTGAGAGGGPHVRGFDVGSGEIVLNQMAYDSAFRGGVNVSAGDWNGDGVADLVTGAGAGGAPHVEVIDGAGGQMLRSFYAGMADDRSGVTASLIARPNGMAIASLMDPDGTPWVRLLAPRSGDDVLTEVASFGPYPGLGRYPSLGISPVNGMGASDSQLFGTAAYLSGINFPEVGIEALDPTAAEAETPPGSSTGLFRVSRSGDAILPLTAYLRIDGTVTPLAKNGDDYAQLPLVSTTYFSGGTSFTENLHKVTFAAHEKRAMIWIAPTNDKIDNEGAEIVRLTVVDTDNNYRATTTQYRTADVTIADNDPFPIPVQSVFFGDGDLVAQQSSNVGMFVLKRTMADSTGQFRHRTRRYRTRADQPNRVQRPRRNDLDHRSARHEIEHRL